MKVIKKLGNIAFFLALCAVSGAMGLILFVLTIAIIISGAIGLYIFIYTGYQTGNYIEASLVIGMVILILYLPYKAGKKK